MLVRRVGFNQSVWELMYQYTLKEKSTFRIAQLVWELINWCTFQKSESIEKVNFWEM